MPTLPMSQPQPLRTFAVAAVLAALAPSLQAQPAPPIANAPADAIYTNARIWTGNAARPEAQAIAIREGKLVAVGSAADALKHRGPATRMVDLQGRRVVPGFSDAHWHLPTTDQADLTDAKSPAEIVRRLKAWAAKQTDVHAKLEALWVTWGMNQVDDGLLREMLASTDFHARAAAVRVLRYNHHVISDHAALLEKAAADEQGRVRLEAIVAASWLPDTNAGKKIVAIASSKPLDVWSQNAAKTAAGLPEEFAAGNRLRSRGAMEGRVVGTSTYAPCFLKKKPGESWDS
jgi:hypothetical protein